MPVVDIHNVSQTFGHGELAVQALLGPSGSGTPRAITGSVATFTPMPRLTISASASSEVTTNGSTATAP